MDAESQAIVRKGRELLESMEDGVFKLSPERNDDLNTLTNCSLISAIHRQHPSQYKELKTIFAGLIKTAYDMGRVDESTPSAFRDL